jgi:subtilisin family serine protease
MRHAIVYATVAVFLLSGYALAQEPKETVVVRHDVPSFVGYVPGQIIVQFKQLSAVRALASPVTGRAGVGVASLDALADRFGVTKVEPLFEGARPKTMNGRVFDLSRHHRVTFDENLDLDEVMAAYRSDPNVESVEPIGIHTVFATPNDPYYSQQWHLNQTNDKDMDAPEAWNAETGDSSIVVAILDTGVRYFHKDLGGSNASYANPTGAWGNMWINWREKNGTASVDDDGNGYVDDWVGYDWVTGVSQCWTGEDCSTVDNDPRDFNGHGTHCSGNVAAINNNAYCTSAVTGGWLGGSQQPAGNGVKVMACRIGWSGKSGSYEVGYVRMDFAASAFYYAADNGAKIASCSWGSSNTGGLGAAIDYFLAAGGIIFKAAGNDGTETADYMCARTDIIAVAATDGNDCKADFSTYGTWVDVSAPGTEILSLYHDHTAPSTDYMAWADGTSMATPLAASVAALIWSNNLGWTASQVKTQLLATTDNIDGLACNASYAGKLGTGRVNAFRAVPDVTPPTVTVVRPNGGETFYGGTQDTIRWVATDNIGVSYVVLYYSTNGGSTYPYLIATGEANDGVYLWTVPYKNSTTAKVKVVAYDAASNHGEDVSNSNFNLVIDVNGPAVTVVKPNGGEVFYGATQDTIKWTAVDEVRVDSVRIYYSTDGGSTYPYTIATGEANDGVYLWTIPATYSTTCRVKVEAYDWAENVGEDVSNANFTISAPPDVTPPEVTVVRPNGGEVFYVASGDTIKWVATDNVGVDHLDIYYSTNGGATYPYTVSTDEANDGVYLWTIPGTPSESCIVKVVAFDAASNSAADTSNAVFTIADGTPPEVTVVKPNGGEVFYVALEDTVKWVATDAFGIDSVSLYYSTDGGTTFPYTIATGEANDGQYVWDVPNTPSATCIMKVVAYDTSENTGEDVSNAVFSIVLETPPEVTVIRPNGGEVFYVAEDDTVRWEATDDFGVDSVSLYYSTDGGSTFPYTITTGEANDGEYLWDVPNTPSTTCIVKVVAYDTWLNTGEDVSDAVFTIETEVGVQPAPGAVVFGLSQNYPNPFNPLTRMEFGLTTTSRVSLRVYDMSGKPVRTLVDEVMGAGVHGAVWDGNDDGGRPVASGVYVTRLVAEGRTAVCKNVLLR